MELTWVLKVFKELTIPELYEILQLRSEVFVVEQNCVYQDIDGKDSESLHLMAYDGNQLVAYCRLVKPGISFDEASIGRVITNPKYRGKGIGVMLIEKAITHTVENYKATKIKIGAQLYLKTFYGNFGFEKTSEVYLEDGIEHIDMILVRK